MFVLYLGTSEWRGVLLYLPFAVELVSSCCICGLRFGGRCSRFDVSAESRDCCTEELGKKCNG